MNEKTISKEKLYKNPKLLIKFILLSAIGIFAFFTPIEVNGSSTIPLEYVISLFINTFPKFTTAYAFIIIMLGAIRPFVKGTWRKDKVSVVFSITKLAGAFFTIYLFSGFAPEAVARDDHGPFLFNSLAIQVGTLIPISAIFITFLMDYGFIDFIGNFLRPIMRAIWKTPGRTAVIAVAAFMGSTAVGVMMTDDLYKERKYTLREAIAVVTGFTTVAISFLIVIANTTDLMAYWSEYVFVSLFVTFTLSAITVRIPPISTASNKYYENKEGYSEEKLEGNLFFASLNEGLTLCKEAGPIIPRTTKNVLDSFNLVFEVLPNFMSIGLIALIIANYTQVFDYFGYILYPVTLLLRIPDPLLAAKAAMLGLAEMFLPVMVITKAPIVTRFIISVMSVAQVIMFSTTIPTIVASEIEVSIKDLVIIWFERTVFCFLITTPIAYLIIK
ncbi:YjiH family protein [Peptoniphilus porci]|uniref:Histidine transporter n=1 Tax=Peptoniphilus porci TaxID=2652280 RepID=A0A1U7M0D7_9FIRM|nr:YjiH family protein [Peptoniphilus porci]OLR65103.1 histidine transporter [Peptoniphilus porci]